MQKSGFQMSKDGLMVVRRVGVTGRVGPESFRP